MDTEDRLKAEAQQRAAAALDQAATEDAMKDFRIDTYGQGNDVTITHLPSGATAYVRGCIPSSQARPAAWRLLHARVARDVVARWPQEALLAFGDIAVKDPPGGIAVEKSLGVGPDGRICAWPSGDPVAAEPLSAEPDPAEDLLKEALRIVTGARRSAYGKPEDNFATIAGLWNTFCQRRRLDFTDPKQGFTAGDTAVMMILLKCARLGESPDHVDSVVDIAGYAACLRRCQAAAETKS